MELGHTPAFLVQKWALEKQWPLGSEQIAVEQLVFVEVDESELELVLQCWLVGDVLGWKEVGVGRQDL